MFKFTFHLRNLFIILGGFLYLSWPLGWLWYPSFFQAPTFYLSELTALSQPTSWVFRTADFLSGLLILLAVSLVLLKFPNRSQAGASLVKVLWAGMGLFGLATVLDSFFPMSCSPTAEAICNQKFLDFSRPITDTVHEFTSSFAQLGIITVLFTALVFLFSQRYAHAKSSRYAFPKVFLAIRIFTLFALSTSLLLAAAPFVSFLPMNIVQPLGVTTWALWIALCSRFFFPLLSIENTALPDNPALYGTVLND